MHRPTVSEPEVVVTPSPDEVQVEVTGPTEEANADAKVKCSDCGDPTSKKTLRHSHSPNSTAKKKQANRALDMEASTIYKVDFPTL